MYAIISSVITFITNVCIELVVYILIDVVAKTSLKETRDDREKRVIWLYESLVLLVAALLVYLFHHSPMILPVLASCTFVYTQLLGRINFRYWWWQLATRWDEFQQHEESMEHYNEMQSRRSAAVQFPNTMATNNPMATVQTNWIPPSVTVAPYGQQQQQPVAYDQSSNEPWYPVDGSSTANVGPVTTALSTGPAPISMAVPSHYSPPSTPPHQMRQQRFMPPTPEFHGPQPIYSSSPIMAQRPSFGATRPELIRRPLHTFMPSPVAKVKPISHSPSFHSIKTRVMSVLGMNEEAPHPPGLPNNGQNICFLNSVLQCLLHTPKLAICLNRDCKTLKSFVSNSGLILCTNELMQKMISSPSESSANVLDHLSFRELASQARGSVIVNPRKSEQQQQDSAEFLMWFLDVLHRGLNSKSVNKNSNQDSPNSYQNVALEMLKYIYGDVSSQRVASLKESCKKEISSAHSLDVAAYAEPIQRLSDLEWLTYKENNNSVIDDLFTGQLVEAQRCVECNRISVNIQTFNLLPVPIVEPRQLNGLVYLEDCFTKFGNAEDLLGPNGLRCECRSKTLSSFTPVRSQQWNDRVSAVSHQAAYSTLHNIRASPALVNGGSMSSQLPSTTGAYKRKLLRSDSALTASPVHPATAMSPIPSLNMEEEVDDSGFHDNQMRTSTPIHGPHSPTKLTDGQRRSLLRQLPECLVIQLMRFSLEGGEISKLHKPVSMPLQGLDLTHLVIDNVMQREDLSGSPINNYKYDLYGVCVHLGGENMACGHYVAYSRQLDGTWYKFNDESVTAVNMEYELTTKYVRENAYLLFYRKSGAQ